MLVHHYMTLSYMTVLSFPFRSISPRSPSRSPARSSPSRSPARRLEDTDEGQLERLYKPVFVLKPTSFKCSQGQTARFDLKVVGRPMPETYWFHNGTSASFSIMLETILYAFSFLLMHCFECDSFFFFFPMCIICRSTSG